MARKSVSTQELIEADRVERDAIVMKDGGLRKVCIVSGLNFELRSEDEQNTTIAGYQSFLNGLDFPIQILVHSRKINIDEYLEGLASVHAKEENALLAGLIGEYQSFVASLVAHNPIMDKKFFVIVPYDPYSPGAEAIITTVFARLFNIKDPAPPPPSPVPDTIKKEIIGKINNAAYIQLDERVEQVISGLARIGLRAVPLTKDELIELLYNLCNPETIERRATARHTL